MNNTENYIVYCCYTKDEVLYVGCGKLGREKHCQSGVSHVYELNKAHFLHKYCGEHTKMYTKIVKYFQTKKQAEEYERELIISILPKHNKAVAQAEKLVSDRFGWLDNAHKQKKSLDTLLELLEDSGSN